jgi:predicted small lipoprotein YifL
MQGFLQVDDNLAAVRKDQCDHTAHALIVDVCEALVIDAVTARFDSFEQNFGMVHEFRVGHYNFAMCQSLQILVSTIALASSAVSLSGCGQQGPLYLPTEPAAANRATLPQTLFRFGSVKASPPEAQVNSSPAVAPANAASAATPAPQ